ncbi:MAG: S8 family serine peptidase [Deltaproteobacteria bacterium]|nr:S8 family serine peptidase [Deltaproteobacteria bacterium]MCL5276929.1 S8 family serine peptidase [Deltaproteobacteria bacterium]
MKTKVMTVVMSMFAVGLLAIVSRSSWVFAQAGNPAWPGTPGTPSQSSIKSSDWVPYLPWDPSYAQAEPGFKYYNPNAGVLDEQWNLLGFEPSLLQGSAALDTPEQMYGVSGISADKAWQYTRGDPHVLIAVLDSGIEWNDRELTDKIYLNMKELPPPCNAAGKTISPSACSSQEFVYNGSCYDYNGDGVFNVADYDASQGGAGYALYNGTATAVTDQNGNGFIDPEDLIIRFGQDGVDADGDGYARDIAGWNFRDNNNDPWDINGFGHGTGEAEDSSAPANDPNVGSAGVCPRCMFMPVRVGDSFVADSNAFAEGVLFATDSGARIIQEALGTINMTHFAQQAIDYAYDHNVVIIASAADEDSMHHNYPSNGDHVVMVHAIATNTLGAASKNPITTFLAFNNCTNYGAHLELSTPSTSCSSGATGKTSGMAGIVESMAFTQGIALTANEVKQILTLTADDINIANSVPGSSGYDPTLYESLPGWDQYFGYGRANLLNAVLSVTTTAIPPEADIVAPNWFQTVDPVRTPNLDIYGYVNARWAGSYDYEVQYGIGITPSSFVTVCPKQAQTSPVSGKLCTIDVASIPISEAPITSAETWTEGGANDYALTIRVRVFDNTHRNRYEQTSDLNGDTRLYGEDRREIFIHHDPDLYPNYPIYLGTSLESSPVFADLYGTGKDDLLIGGSDGKVYGFDKDGNPLPGFPLTTDVLEVFDASEPANVVNHLRAPAYAGGTISPASASILSTVAVGDLLGNGVTDIVAATMDGHVYAWDNRGDRLPGFPVHINYQYSDFVTNSALRTAVVDSFTCNTKTDPKCQPNPKNDIPDHAIFASPVLYPLSGKGLDIIVAAEDQHVYIWDGTGALITEFAVYDNSTSHYRQYTRILSTPAIGDILGNGQVQIALGTNENYNGASKAYVLNMDGSYAPGWPQSLYAPDSAILPYVGVGIPTSPVLFDLGTGQGMKIAFNDVSGDPVIYNPDGTVYQQTGGAFSQYIPTTTAKETEELTLLSNMAVGSVLGDGSTELAYGSTGFGILSMEAFGGLREPFDHLVSVWDVNSKSYVSPFPEIIEDWQMLNSPVIADIGGRGMPDVIEGSAGYQVWAWDADGDMPTGWPKFTGGWILASAAVGNVDSKSSPSGTNEIQWAKFRHDLWNTGNYTTPLPVRNGRLAIAASTREGYLYLWKAPSGASSGSSGCSCDTSGTATGMDLLLAVLIGAVPLLFIALMKRGALL